MRVALDTNILLRLMNDDAPEHSGIQSAIVELERRGHILCMVPQTLIEFWAVATRPAANNGLGLSPGETAKRLDLLQSIYLVLEDDPDIFAIWRELVIAHNVSGRQVHDTRLAACFKFHAIGDVLTINARDFRRFGFLRCFGPEDVIGRRLPS